MKPQTAEERFEFVKQQKIGNRLREDFQPLKCRVCGERGFVQFFGCSACDEDHRKNLIGYYRDQNVLKVTKVMRGAWFWTSVGWHLIPNEEVEGLCLQILAPFEDGRDLQESFFEVLTAYFDKKRLRLLLQ